jgi:acyl-CoA synthetase (AMP-forming)/AMP-acid ligase II
MCGIVGIVQFDSSPVDRELLGRMLGPIGHRGPDESGLYVNGPAGLAHARLSIIDLTGGQQPMPNEDRSLWITFNGEIFNYVVGAAAGDDRPPPKRAIDIDLAALIYTSGSTGNPKGVMLTHLNMVSAATSITTYLENTPDDIILNVLPLSFDYGLYQVLMAAKFGGTVVLERSFAYPHAVIQRLIEERVTGFPLVPTMSAILLQMDLAKYDWSSLRYITNTAAACPMRKSTSSMRRATASGPARWASWWCGART